jgi:hypothetical protein
MAITALPTPPSRLDPANFATQADAFLGALPIFQTEANALQLDVNSKYVYTVTSADTAYTNSLNAAASALAAANSAGASIWISGTTYAIGDTRFSPLNYLTYRRKTAGAGATDPSQDSTNWQLLTAVGEVLSNRIINGDMRVAQRGNKSVVNSVYTYGGADRWCVQPFTFTTITGTIKQFTGVASSSGYAQGATITTTGTGQFQIEQRIEALNTIDLNNKTVILTMSVYQNSGSTKSVSVGINRPLSTADDFSSQQSLGQAATASVASGVLTKLSFIKTFGATDANLGLSIFATFLLLGALTDVNIYVADCMLEVGSLSTEFKPRPYTLELYLCGSPASNSLGFTRGITVADVNGGQLAGLRNRIINGGMIIAQRGTSFPAAANATFAADRFPMDQLSAAVLTVSQQTDAPSNSEFQSSARLAITTADSSISTSDYCKLDHSLEGYNVRDFIGKTFTLSFWVRSSKTGIHCIAFRNNGSGGVPDRSYIAEYTVNAINTWEKKSITVTGGLPASGTWNFTNGAGLYVSWILACGTTYQTTANAWQTGNLIATSSQVNCLDTIGNIFAITGVQLEIGSVATTFEQRPYGMELTLCQRYYQKTYAQGVAPGTAGAVSTFRHTIEGTCSYSSINSALPVVMRTAPTTATVYAPNSGASGQVNVDSSSPSAIISATESNVLVYVNNVSFVANQFLTAHYTLSAEL